MKERYESFFRIACSLILIVSLVEHEQVPVKDNCRETIASDLTEEQDESLRRWKQKLHTHALVA